MAVLFGELPDKEGWIKVSMIRYNIDSHEDGHSINKEDIPDYPKGGKGVGWVQYYHPEKREFKYKEIEVSYTKEESMLEIAAAIRELAQVIKEK